MYVDANVFVFAACDDGPRGDAARSFLRSSAKKVASVLVLDELIWVMRKNGHTPIIRRYIEKLYSSLGIAIVGVPAHIALPALDIMEKHNLKPRDAMHLAIMREIGETDIASDDADFDRIPGIKRVKF